MRTTVTLDDDVAEAVERELRRQPQKTTFKAVVNELLRSGIHARHKAAHAPAFRVTARSLGVRPELDYDHISALLEELDGVSHQ